MLNDIINQSINQPKPTFNLPPKLKIQNFKTDSSGEPRSLPKPSARKPKSAKPKSQSKSRMKPGMKSKPGMKTHSAKSNSAVRAEVESGASDGRRSQQGGNRPGRRRSPDNSDNDRTGS